MKNQCYLIIKLLNAKCEEDLLELLCDESFLNVLHGASVSVPLRVSKFLSVCVGGGSMHKLYNIIINYNYHYNILVGH